MAPRAAFQCVAPKPSVFAAAATPKKNAIEYGYWQIENYKAFRKSGRKAHEEARWIALPWGTPVLSYTSHESCSVHQVAAQTAGVVPAPLRSCMKHSGGSSPTSCTDIDDFCTDVDIDDSFDTMSTASTSASLSSFRHVHFCDELLPDIWEDIVLDEKTSPDMATSTLAEWIYIDRDICGLSLHEYDPEWEFASSQYGFGFLADLAEIEFSNRYERQRAASLDEVEDMSIQEERKLDKALLMAGVHAACLHALPDDIDEPSEIFI